MYQTIHEYISVAGVFEHGKFIPKKFQWKQKVFHILEITTRSTTREYGKKIDHYSFTVKELDTVVRTTFNHQSNNWNLEEIWIEG